MIIEEGKHYLYRHIRLDKNEVFYVGIGTKYKTIRKYKRAYSSKDRNSMWKRIINKTDYKVEILLESDDYDFIIEKEKEFILLYGRKDIGTGTLTNLTDGGEGFKGVIFSKERLDKISKSLKGRIITEEWRRKLSASTKGRKMDSSFGEKVSKSLKGKPRNLSEEGRLKLPRGANKVQSKLTEEQVIIIKKHLSNGCTYKEMAEKYQVSKTVIRSIYKGLKWSYLKSDDEVMVDKRRGYNRKSKLNPEKVLVIKRMLQEGVQQKEIAKQFNISGGALSDIKNGKRWANIVLPQ